MKSLHTAIESVASPEDVWAVLADLDHYPNWNPFIPRIAGTLAEGERLAVRLAPPGGGGMTFRPTVLAATTGRELRWLGRLLVRGLFDGEHRFVQEERFTGLLVPLFARSLDGPTPAGFEAMNRALKDRAEAPAPAAPGRAR